MLDLWILSRWWVASVCLCICSVVAVGVFSCPRISYNPQLKTTALHDVCAFYPHLLKSTFVGSLIWLCLKIGNFVSPINRVGYSTVPHKMCRSWAKEHFFTSFPELRRDWHVIPICINPEAWSWLALSTSVLRLLEKAFSRGNLLPCLFLSASYSRTFAQCFVDFFSFVFLLTLISYPFPQSTFICLLIDSGLLADQLSSCLTSAEMLMTELSI